MKRFPILRMYSAAVLQGMYLPSIQTQRFETLFAGYPIADAPQRIPSDLLNKKPPFLRMMEANVQADGLFMS
ncbi:hypothetical protein PVOR_09525 [Paenibacillus vortex V453]|uniref:Uncharacterized protein n=1 Tax=Paenibacillus vortex V453 TaxID=715225 RepID=A0A2R9SYN3_9BACL|nr:hypothetical protein PVOR_09525 [Paenibacillus vortex V453]